MTDFSLDAFVSAARAAARAEDPLSAVDALMVETFADPDALAAAIPTFDTLEVRLFEDETVSIWHECFLATEILPAHNHAMPAVIGVYRGRERNLLFRPSGAGLARGGSLDLGPGDTHVFGAADVHTVQGLDGAPSFGLHVYLGPLSEVPRLLYAWDTLEPRPMTGANFDALKRPA